MGTERSGHRATRYPRNAPWMRLDLVPAAKGRRIRKLIFMLHEHIPDVIGNSHWDIGHRDMLAGAGRYNDNTLR
jgi:hypothetical protein